MSACFSRRDGAGLNRGPDRQACRTVTGTPVGIALQPAAGGGFFVCSGAALPPRTELPHRRALFRSEPSRLRCSYASQQPFTVVQGTVHNHPDWCLGCGRGTQGITIFPSWVKTSSQTARFDSPNALAGPARSPGPGGHARCAPTWHCRLYGVNRVSPAASGCPGGIVTATRNPAGKAGRSSNGIAQLLDDE